MMGDIHGHHKQHTVIMPGTETTTYTTTQSAPRFAAIQPKYNPSYLRSIGFVLTIIELLLSLIVIICIGSTRWTSYYGIGFGIFTGVLGLLLGFAVLGIRSFDIHQNVTHFPWAAFWFGAHLFLAFCFFITGAICVAAADYANKGYGLGYVNSANINLNNQPPWNNQPWGNQAGWNTAFCGEVCRLIRDGCAAAAFFAWIATILYIVHAVFYFRGFRANSFTEHAPGALPWQRGSAGGGVGMHTTTHMPGQQSVV